MLLRTQLINTLLLLLVTLTVNAQAKDVAKPDVPQTIISLAPHTTELVYALNAQDKLIAVSDYSDFPTEASELPSVSSYQGVDFEAILRLKPDLILAWRGGNKAQDLSRLESLGFKLFYSGPQTLADISKEIMELGLVLGQQEQAAKLSLKYNNSLSHLKETYKTDKALPVFYYLWPKPLMTIGKNAWGNELLEVCGARNIFDSAINDYPEVPMESVVRKQPAVLIAVNKEPIEQITTFWRPWLKLLAIQEKNIKQANPDLLHRFTPRLLQGLTKLCKDIHTP